ncbi:MAG: hypothetical protein M9898_07295 [Chitinophagaceae bacterium]|nr:hypothetical protein [Chitinophagaceae bacterium]
MRILIFGAGVIGKIYGAKLFHSGFDVTLFARGTNFQKLTDNGLTLKNKLTGEKIHSKIPVIQSSSTSQNFDIIIVTVQLDQLLPSIPTINEFKNCQNILFMLNNPKELKVIKVYFPTKNILFGFPGVSGTKTENSIEFIQIKQQNTTIGYDPNNSKIVEKIKYIFSKSGFPTVYERRMTDWLIIHAIFITCTSVSILNEDSNSEQLSHNKKAVQKMVRSIKEGLKSCQEQNITVVPKNIKTIFLTMPEWFSVFYWKRAMRGNIGKLGIEPHAKVATHELKILARQVLEIVQNSKVKTTNIDSLLQKFIE